MTIGYLCGKTFVGSLGWAFFLSYSGYEIDNVIEYNMDSQER